VVNITISISKKKVWSVGAIAVMHHSAIHRQAPRWLQLNSGCCCCCCLLGKLLNSVPSSSIVSCIDALMPSQDHLEVTSCTYPGVLTAQYRPCFDTTIVSFSISGTQFVQALSICSSRSNY
jgi:hypothetical protein